MVGPGITIWSQVVYVFRISTAHMPHVGFYALDSRDDREREVEAGERRGTSIKCRNWFKSEKNDRVSSKLFVLLGSVI